MEMRFIEPAEFFQRYNFSSELRYLRRETGTNVLTGRDKRTGQNLSFKSSFLNWGLPDIVALSALPGYQEYNIIPILEYTWFVRESQIHVVIVQPYAEEIRETLFNLPMIQMLLRDILPALRFIHLSGIVHCDIKPENILFYKDKYCLNDFGRARKCIAFDDGKIYAYSRLLSGIYGDFCSKGDYVSQKCDIFALAKTCIRLVTQDSTAISNFPPNFKMGGTLDSLFASLIRRMMAPVEERASIDELLLHPFVNLSLAPLCFQPKPKIIFPPNRKRYNLIPIFRKLFSLASEFDYQMDTLMVTFMNVYRIVPYFKLNDVSEILQFSKVILLVTSISMNEYVKIEDYGFESLDLVISQMKKIFTLSSGFLTPYTPFDFVTSPQDVKTVVYDILQNNFSLGPNKTGFQIPYSVREFLKYFKEIIGDVNFSQKISNREDYLLENHNPNYYETDKEKLFTYLNTHPFDVRTINNHWNHLKDLNFGPKLLEKIFGEKSAYYRSWDILLGSEICDSLLLEKDWERVISQL